MGNPLGAMLGCHAITADSGKSEIYEDLSDKDNCTCARGYPLGVKATHDYLRTNNLMKDSWNS